MARTNVPRYLSRNLPSLKLKGTWQETFAELHEETSRRFGEMYVFDGDGSGGSGSGAAVGDVFLILVPITFNITITESYLANISAQASGNHPIAVAVIQDDDVGGHLVQWDDDDFVGANTAGLNQASNDWSVDDGPRKVTVYNFVRHPTTLKWWLTSWLSYTDPEYL